MVLNLFINLLLMKMATLPVFGMRILVIVSLCRLFMLCVILSRIIFMLILNLYAVRLLRLAGVCLVFGIPPNLPAVSTVNLESRCFMRRRFRRFSRSRPIRRRAFRRVIRRRRVRPIRIGFRRA